MNAQDPKSDGEAAVARMQSRSTLAVVAALLGLSVWLAGLRYPARVAWPLDGDGPRLAGVQRGIEPNTAKWFELAQLPGIGPSLARRIVEFRNQRTAAATADTTHVVFRRAADLEQVKGIGVKTVQRMGPFLRFPAPAG